MSTTNGFQTNDTCVGDVDMDTCVKVRRTFGYCPNCCEKVPKYVPLPQWKKWINEYKDKYMYKF